MTARKIDLDPDLWRDVRIRAFNEGRTATAVVTEALRQYLAAEAPEPAAEAKMLVRTSAGTTLAQDHWVRQHRGAFGGEFPTHHVVSRFIEDDGTLTPEGWAVEAADAAVTIDPPVPPTPPTIHADAPGDVRLIEVSVTEDPDAPGHVISVVKEEEDPWDALTRPKIASVEDAREAAAKLTPIRPVPKPGSKRPARSRSRSASKTPDPDQ